MRRLARRTIVLVEVAAAVAVGVVVAVLIFLWHVNNSDYRRDVAVLVEQTTGLRVLVAGGLQFGLTPLPTMVATDVHVANPSWAGRSEMMHIDRVDLSVSPIDLLRQHNRLLKLVLSGADIHLEYDGHRRVNWWQAGDDAPPAESPPAPFEPLDIAGLEVVHSRIDYRDDGSGRTVRLGVEQAAIGLPLDGPLTVRATGDFFGTPFIASVTGGRFADLVNDRPLWPVSWTLGGAEATVEGHGTLDRPISQLILDLGLSGAARRLAALAPVFGVSLPELGPLGGSARLTGGWSHYRLDELKGSVGISDFSGDLALVTGGRRLRLDGRLQSRLLDRRDLVGNGKDAPAFPADGRLFDPRPLPLSLLQAVDGRVDLAVARLVTAPVDLFDLTATLDLADGRLTVQPLRATVGGGRIDFALSVDAGREPPAIGITGHGDGVASEQLFPGQGATPGPTGPLSASLDLTGTGASLRAFLAHASGRVWLAIGPGTLPVRHFDLIASDLVAAIMPWADRTGDSTALNCLVARFRIRNGIADAEHLLIDTGKITVTGTGQIDLGTEGIDLKLDPRPKDPALISLATRMRVTGTLAEHSAAPDAIGLATGAATGLMLAIGELNPLALMLPFISIGTGVANPCLAELSGRSQAVVFHGVTPLESLGGLLGSIGHAITQGVGP